MPSGSGASLAGTGGPEAGASTDQKPAESTETVPSDIFDYYDKMDNEEEEGEDLKTVSFEVKQDRIEDIQKR